MSRAEQKRFIQELMESVQRSMLEELHKVPEDWDGFELRWWLEYCFERCSPHRRWSDRKKRYKAFKNEIIVSNL